MKICEYHPRLSYHVGGGEMVVIDQIKRLSKRHDVTILTSRTDKLTEQFSKLIADYEVKVIFFENKFVAIPPSIWEDKGLSRWDLESLEFGQITYDFLAKNSFDLIVCHYSVDCLLLPKKARKILHFHGVPPRWKKIDEVSLNEIRNFVAVSSFVAEEWRKMHKIKKAAVCYNGIDLEKFQDKKTKRDIDVLYIGRLVAHKRLDILLDALKSIKNIKVVIGGMGVNKKELEKLAKKYGLKIDFAGYIPDKELVNYYNRAKIFVHTADTREGVITTGLEAMACGAIPVFSHSCGMIEAVSDGENGLTFTPLDSSKLTDKIKYVLENFSSMGEIRKKARLTVERKFDCNKTINGLEKLYLKVAGRKNAKS